MRKQFRIGICDLLFAAAGSWCSWKSHRLAGVRNCVFMCACLFIVSLWISQSAEQAAGRELLLSWLSCWKDLSWIQLIHQQIFYHSQELCTGQFGSEGSSPYHTLTLESCNSLRSCPQEAFCKGNRNQTFLWCWNISKLRDIPGACEVGSTNHTAELQALHGITASMLCVQPGTKMQDWSQKVASEHKSGSSPKSDRRWALYYFLVAKTHRASWAESESGAKGYGLNAFSCKYVPKYQAKELPRSAWFVLCWW